MHFIPVNLFYACDCARILRLIHDIKMRRNITLIARNALESVRKSALPNDKNLQKLQIRNLSYHEATERRNQIFNQEKKRQQDNVGRIEKIEVRYLGVPKDTTLVMNKDMSTPYDCAQHLGQIHMERSALALLDGANVWDMHRPLPHSCALELLHFMVPDPLQVNRAFWRTCSFVLGAVAERAFKDNYQVRLHSFPSPDVRSGSFVYDVELPGLEEWSPEPWECRALSAEYIKLCRTAEPLERLTVRETVALDMFQDNPHKTKQIPDIARKNEGDVTLYRAKDHIDISKGPMIANLSQIGRVSVPAVHRLTGGPLTLHRFQGVGLPTGIIINHMAYRILQERAAKLNPARSPLEPYPQDREEHVSQAVA